MSRFSKTAGQNRISTDRLRVNEDQKGVITVSPRRRLPILQHADPRSEPYWYTAEQIVQATARELNGSTGQELRWMTEGVNFLPDAQAHGDLDRCLIEPTTSIDTRWDTLIAATIRYRLRTMGVEAPRWTYKAPLNQMWFISGVLPSRVASAINLAPPELRRVGIMLPRTALDI